MRISSHSRNAERVRLNSQSKGNWMHLTIAPLVAEKLLSEDPLRRYSRTYRSHGRRF
jgi:hypothetical protein